VLGVVSTKSPDLESLDDLAIRVHLAAGVIARGQGRSVSQVMDTSLGVSPQCGFASMSLGGGVGMTMDIMWDKLLLVKHLAKRIWSE
jgi:methionine synthase II (cobalamin-independent)